MCCTQYKGEMLLCERRTFLEVLPVGIYIGISLNEGKAVFVGLVESPFRNMKVMFQEDKCFVWENISK